MDFANKWGHSWARLRDSQDTATRYEVGDQPGLARGEASVEGEVALEADIFAVLCLWWRALVFDGDHCDCY